jgi:hypothetical protein
VVAVFSGVELALVDVVPETPAASGTRERPFDKRPFEEEAVGTAELRSGCSVGGMEGVPAELRSGSVVRGLDGVADSLVRSREESREVTELSPVDPAGAFAGAIVE